MTIKQHEDVTTAGRWDRLAESVLDGHILNAEQGLAVLQSDDTELPALLAAAFRVRRHSFGQTVHLYYLKNAKSGLCSEDCGYCSQAAGSTADIPKYPLLDAEQLLAGAEQAVQNNARTYCIVASGRGPSNREVTQVADIVRRIKAEHPLHICCCLGLLTSDQALTLKEAGVDRINHNLNTSRNHHPQICTTHTYDDRLQTLRNARQAGLELCAGLIVGMGESEQDVVDVALQLRELEVNSIPVNFLNPIDGTPLAGTDVLNPRYCLKSLCLMRFANPSTEIRIAGGRELQLRSMQAMGLYPANSLFVSDYLTTPGQPVRDDFRMIEDLGFEVVIDGDVPENH